MYLPLQYPKLSDLKTARLAAGLKQIDLERLSGVSQSIITKVEREQRSPRYETMVKLFTAISKEMEDQAQGDTRKAHEIMTKKVLSFQVDTLVGVVKVRMKNDAISQYPVYWGDDLVGTVTERSVLGEEDEDTLKDHMEDILPILSQNTLVSKMEKILKHFSAVLLSNDNGKVVGICCRSDYFPD